MKILACGSRDWDDLELIRQHFVGLGPADVLIVGGAGGADSLAEQVGREFGMQVQVYPADWQGYGKRAGMLRNKQMIDQGPDEVWAFWDGVSRGTAHTIKLAKRAGIILRIWRPDGSVETILPPSVPERLPGLE